MTITHQRWKHWKDDVLSWLEMESNEKRQMAHKTSMMDTVVKTYSFKRQ